MLAWCESDSETCSYIESSTGKECRFRGLMKLVDKWVLILHQKSDEEIRETIQTRVIRRLPLKSTRELCILIVFGHLLARRLPNPRICYLIHQALVKKMSALHMVKSKSSDAPEPYVMSHNFRWFVTTPTIVKSRVKRKAKKTFSTYFTCLEDGIRQLRTGEGLYVAEEPVSLSNESGSSE